MIAFLFALPLALVASDQDDIKKLALGDRVEVTFPSGATLTGKVVADPGAKEKVESVDLGQRKAFTIDVSLEYPGLTGTMTILKSQIKAVRRIRNLDAKTLEEIERQRAILKKQREEEAAKPKSPAPATEPAAPEPPKAPTDAKAGQKKLEDLKKGQELYAKYPPPAWGPDRNTAIRLKIVRGQIPLPAEQEFHSGFSLWELGRRAAEAKEPNRP